MLHYIRLFDPGTRWYLFSYENMVQDNYAGLNGYLGYAVLSDQEVPDSPGKGKTKVIRKKAISDWRHWLSPEDVERFRSPFLPYMGAVGCDPQD